MEKICEQCSRPFKARPYKARAGKARYCSVVCYRDSVKAPERLCLTCGEPIPQTGWSYEAKYCSRACFRIDQPNPAFKDGRRLDKLGYIRVWAPDNPMARADGYVAEHRLVMAEAIGRPLNSSWVVHHRNGDKADNRIENLELFTSQGAHLSHEFKSR